MIDASVLVKWFVDEPDSGTALALRDRHVNGEVELAAPVLILFEALNALRYTGLYSTQELKSIASSIGDYGLSLHGFAGRNADLAVEAAEENDITVYDGSYVGLALGLAARFITADRRLLEKLRGRYAACAMHLSEVAGGSTPPGH